MRQVARIGMQIVMLVLVLALAACKWTKEDVAGTDSPKKLKRIYKEAEDADVKAAALVKIDDPAFLLSVARGLVKGATEADRHAALSRLSAAQLGDFLTGYPHPTPAQIEAAAQAFEDEIQMVGVALVFPPEQAELMLNHVTEQPALIRFFENYRDHALRRLAFERITDQNYLADFVIDPSTKTYGDLWPDLSAHILMHLTDVDLITKVVLDKPKTGSESKNLKAFKTALVQQLSDPEALEKIAINGRWYSETAVDRITDPEALARVAFGADWPTVRTAAIGRITDPDVLMEVRAKDHENAELAAQRFEALGLPDKDAYVGKWSPWFHYQVTAELTDPALLGEIARYADNYRVVQAAIGNPMTPDAALEWVAKKGDPARLRMTAAERLDDQDIYAFVAVNDLHHEIRLEAAEYLTEQPALARVYKGEGFVYREHAGSTHNEERRRNQAVRLHVLGKITDQPILVEAVQDTSLAPEFRFAAAPRVEDQEVLKTLARHDRTIERQIGASGLRDEPFLLAMFKGEPSEAVRTTIINRLATAQSLQQIALTAFNEADRAYAAKRLGDDLDADMTRVAAAFLALKLRVDGIRQGEESERLVDLALSAEFDVIMQAAAETLSKPEDLETVAIRGRDRKVLAIVLDGLSDSEVLDRVSQNAGDRAMRIAALRKTGAVSWNEIFDQASAKTATVAQLGDALAAVTLFVEDQPDAIKGVHSAALNLIRNGDEARIPEMADILHRYGDKRLAEDYLNSGQPDLDNEGRKWARARGYNVTTGAGSARARWGSRK